MTSQDSFRPVLMGVSINLSSYTASAPADGTIDPITIKSYEQIKVYTASSNYSTVTTGDTIFINDCAVTFTTGAGLTLADVAATINTLTDEHHVIASVSGSKLVMQNEPLYETYGIQVVGSTADLTDLGFVNPVITTPYSAGVDTLVDSTAKSRGNSRWNTMMKLLSFEGTVLNVGGVRMTGNTINAAPSALSFTVAYPDYGQIYTYDELNNNALMEGVQALIRKVARALAITYYDNLDIINPAVLLYGSTYVEGEIILNTEIAALDTLTGATANITVTPFTLSR